ncbi:MAG TPA: hypothetical protein VIP48_16215 [Streptosporangiaceae bacterium]
MSRGGEPERDDYGLPPVDIEIPDDARELDHDVQAYHRELRALRRQRLLRRLAGPIARDGMVLPLLASCLALTLLAGTLLTMFTTRRADAPLTQAQAPTTPQSASPGVGQVGGPLPASTVRADRRPLELSTIRTAVLALVPPGCHCATAAKQVSSQASAADVEVYLIAVGPSLSQVKAMAQARGNAPVTIHVASDTDGALNRAYRPDRLTVVLVDRVGSVRVIQKNLRTPVQLGDSLQLLGSSAPQTLDRPASPVLAASQAS